jgi:hypothetical protein
MERVRTTLYNILQNKWGRRLTGAALVWFSLELIAALLVVAGFTWLR